MFQNLNKILVNCLIDMFIFLEFTEEDLLNEDKSIEMLEQLSSVIQTLNDDEKIILANEIKGLINAYPENMRDFISKLPQSIGI